MLPSPRYSRLSDHKYTLSHFSVLKLASLYGANAAGKSNLIRSLGYLQSIVKTEALPPFLNDLRHKFVTPDDESILLGVEFSINGITLSYAIEIVDGRFAVEELVKTSNKPELDVLIFKRTTDKKGKTTLELPKQILKDQKTNFLKEVIEKNLSSPEKPVLKLLSKLKEDKLSEVGFAMDWFEKKLQILIPESKPLGLAQRIDSQSEFRNYAQNILCSFNVGIKSVLVKKTPIEDFFGEESKEERAKIQTDLMQSENQLINLKSDNGDSIDIVKEGDKIIVKQIRFLHKGDHPERFEFRMDEESDGTIRLLDFIPAFKDLISSDKVYIVDEIERSIHPLLIKELVRKFSGDKGTKGQLIFTTHESNLLDQDIFRQDEIWFAEKNPLGSTEIYSLSDFKEHSTIDIRKGYLNGRYGSIPFLANLTDLNWH